MNSQEDEKKDMFSNNFLGDQKEWDAEKALNKQASPGSSLCTVTRSYRNTVMCGDRSLPGTGPLYSFRQ